MYRAWVAVGGMSEQPQIAAALILLVVASPAIIVLGSGKNSYWPIDSLQSGELAGIRGMSSTLTFQSGT